MKKDEIDLMMAKHLLLGVKFTSIDQLEDYDLVPIEKFKTLSLLNFINSTHHETGYYAFKDQVSDKMIFLKDLSNEKVKKIYRDGKNHFTHILIFKRKIEKR